MKNNKVNIEECKDCIYSIENRWGYRLYCIFIHREHITNNSWCLFYTDKVQEGCLDENKF